MRKARPHRVHGERCPASAPCRCTRASPLGTAGAREGGLALWGLLLATCCNLVCVAPAHPVLLTSVGPAAVDCAAVRRCAVLKPLRSVRLFLVIGWAAPWPVWEPRVWLGHTDWARPSAASSDGRLVVEIAPAVTPHTRAAARSPHAHARTSTYADARTQTHARRRTHAHA
jgi:hypothetical protein